MHTLDWTLLIGSLIFITVYGIWKGRGASDLNGYLLADKSMRWYTVLFSIMATQASAITFLSTPGQAFVDGLGFVQFYFGLPLAMIVLSITVVPIFHNLNVYTAYEYLEKRFDLKTRSLAAFLFLVQRGLAAGLTIYAPSIILSTLLGWNLYGTNILMGGVVILYTTSGGNKAVSWTHMQQMMIIFFGMTVAFVTILFLLPKSMSIVDGLALSGSMGKLNTIDFSFNLQNRYTFWSGLLGGFFLQLSYFGTDQSQVARYLTGASVAQSRIGLLVNGLLKVPMQFFILLLGVMVYVFFQFNQPPIFFNKPVLEDARRSRAGEELTVLEKSYQNQFQEKQKSLNQWLQARHEQEPARAADLQQQWQASDKKMTEIRKQAISAMKTESPKMDIRDTNFIFLSFVVDHLPIGLVGLVMAAIIAASMSSTAAELNALASTSVVDVYKRLIAPNADSRRTLKSSRLLTVFWGVFAIIFAEYASRLGSLIEAVNILGSLFYGTILGIFVVAFYLKKIGGSATFYGALTAEGIVVLCFLFSKMSFLWYNAIGCLTVVLLGWLFQKVLVRK
jgi:solute:Na+ symporter, SSS family